MCVKKCVLAYSGGLDTSAMVPWLRDKGYEVHAVLVDVGQDEDLGALCKKALRYGAATAVVRDAKPAMYERVIPLAIGLCATYEGNYRLGTALARPFITLEQVRVAKQLGGATLAHGATGKGNDQVRFEFGYRSLAPECPILAPWKTWEFGGRADLVNYLKDKGFSDNYAVQKDYSLDENLWHISIEGGPLEEPNTTIDVEEVLHSVDGHFAWDNTYGEGPPAVEIQLQAGVPVALNGEKKGLSDIVAQLNHQYRQAPWAWDLIIENRFTGIKSRGLYVNPAAKLLHLAADNLARTCLNKPTYDQYVELGQGFGTLMYRGEYFSDQRVVIEAAARSIMTQLNGSVTVQLKPTPYVTRIANTSSIFTKEMATFEKSDYAHQDAAGFIRLSWLSNVGKPFVEENYGGLVEAKSSAASGVCTVEPVPPGRLVSAPV
ncbi:MAG: argininosuccinate synthase [Phycisphaerae bacterium]